MNKRENTKKITFNKKNISNCVWCAKAVAILCVIVAHSDFQNVQINWLAILLQRIGAMGVPIFFILSAYYYRPKKYDSVRDFLKSRITTFLPWVILATACYLWSNIRMEKELGIQSCIKFILGYNSLFYFLPILILLQLLFYLFRFVSIRKTMGIWILLSIISTELAAFGITDGFISGIGLTNYLNIFNWVGFFAIGLYFQTKEDEKVMSSIKNISGRAFLIWILLFIIGCFIERNQYGYFSVLGWFMELASSILILRLSWCLCRFRWLVQLGKYSFAVYLVHINVVPIVNKFLGGNMFGEIISPLCTYITSILLIVCACFIMKKIKMGYLTKYILGVRVK